MRSASSIRPRSQLSPNARRRRRANALSLNVTTFADQRLARSPITRVLHSRRTLYHSKCLTPLPPTPRAGFPFKQAYLHFLFPYLYFLGRVLKSRIRDVFEFCLHLLWVERNARGESILHVKLTLNPNYYLTNPLVHRAADQLQTMNRNNYSSLVFIKKFF